jgi:hypothetical protein
MTTNVYCRPKGWLASDSRWTFESDFAYLYVDDTGFDKIDYLHDKAGFLFAGNSKVIASWRKWINSSPNNFDNLPDPDGISFCIVKPDRSYVEFHGYKISDAWFAGTGYTYAALCYGVNQDAKRAIASAKQMDPFSGGSTKYFELSSRDNNLNPYPAQCLVSTIAIEAIKRGTVMYRDNEGSTRIPVQEAAANDTRVKDLCDKIATGSLHASAPCLGASTPWNDAEKEQLKDELAKIFGIRK